MASMSLAKSIEAALLAKVINRLDELFVKLDAIEHNLKQKPAKNA